MRVGLISTPWVPVPPCAYGGTETMVDNLARALVALGQEVLLFATGDSTCPVPKAWAYEEPATPMGNVVAEARHAISAYQAVQDCDVVHDQTVFGPLYAGRFSDLPLVTTIHGPFTPEARVVYGHIAQHAEVAAISRNQRRQAPEVPVGRVIHHGIHAGDFAVGRGDGGFLLFLGRMSPEKGVHHAQQVARRLGMPLVIAAKMRATDECEYFRSKVEPRLGNDIEYVGEVTVDDRMELLGSARALINPICWPEPFGLVMIEAMACGTPVVAYGRGAAPEIVDDGKTGFLCQNEDEMVAAVQRLDEIDRGSCRQAVERRFSAERMALEYLDLYEEARARTRRGNSAVTLPSPEAPEEEPRKSDESAVA